MAVTEEVCLKLPQQWQRNSGQKQSSQMHASQALHPQIGGQSPKGTQTRQAQEHTYSRQRSGLVVLDRKEYIRKAMDLWGDKDTYRPLTSDPTNKYKNKIINHTQDHQNRGRIKGHHLQKAVLSWNMLPKILWAPKIHIKGTPIGP